MGILLALGSGLVYGVSDYVGGRASRRRPPIVIAFVAELAMLCVMLAVVPVVEATGPSGRALWWGIVGGIAGSLGVLGLYVSLSKGNMTVVAPVTGVVAAAVPVVAGLVLGERPGVLAGVGIVFALSAVALVSGAVDGMVGVGNVAVAPAIVVLAVLAGAGFGMLFVAYSRTGDSGLWPLLTGRIGATPLLLAALLVARSRGPLHVSDREVLLPGLAIGLMIGLANGLYLLATRRGLLSVVAVLVALYPASTVALATVLDGERATRWQLVGMVVAGLAVACITVGS
ncbi:EamA family transporter [Ilumatobacter sp.]|uniref:EamA family transporter n=1 Tax=Ilumatobacter sp. TaxID=1967498 RepID=UPI003AF44F0B